MYVLWGQKIRKLSATVGSMAGPILIIAVISTLILIVIFGYTHKLDWTGVFWHARPEEKQNLQYKTLWDWLQLLIVPAMLALGGFWFAQIQKGREERLLQQRDKTERDIVLDNQREAALQAYIDNMSNLLLEKQLYEARPDDEVAKIARVRTIRVLYQLDAKRIGYVFAFLRESGLMSNQPDRSIVTFNNEDLSQINFHGADLHQANLSGAILHQANLSSAILSQATLSGATLHQATLNGANLSCANLDGACLSQANLNDANLNDANLSEADLNGSHLNRADLSNADLSRVNFERAHLHQAHLNQAHLNFAQLRQANVSGADLTGASLTGACFIGASLTGANLTEATFVESTLSQADLSGANLSGANLSGVSFKESILNKANFTGAKVTLEQLQQAKSLAGTIKPDGSKWT